MNKEEAKQELIEKGVNPNMTADITPRKNHCEDMEMIQWIERVNFLLKVVRGS